MGVWVGCRRSRDLPQLRCVRTHDEVSRFDVTVDEVAPVHGVHAFQQLVRKLQGCLQREPSAALGVLERKRVWEGARGGRGGSELRAVRGLHAIGGMREERETGEDLPW